MIAGAVYGVAAVWGCAAVVAFAIGRPFAGSVIGATALVTWASVWALTPRLDDMLDIRFPTRLSVRCVRCDEQWSATQPWVEVWADTLEAHMRTHHDPMPDDLVEWLAGYRQALRLAAVLTTGDDDL